MRSGLTGRSRAVLLLLVATALVAVIGLLDYWTGYDLSFSLFYLAPVALLSWRCGRGAGYYAAALSAGAWLVANTLTEPGQRLLPVIAAWNGGIRLGFFVIVASLLSSLRESHERERELARTDPLTGVGNSRAFLELGRLELLRADRVGYPVSLIYLDLDDFKTVNDTQGHAAGDELLRAVGRVLGESLRSTDLVGRVGGDEFAILLPDTDRDQVAWVAQKVRAAVGAASITGPGRVSLSMGVVTFTSPPASIEMAMSQADALMYEVKASGKNDIRFQTLPTDG